MDQDNDTTAVATTTPMIRMKITNQQMGHDVVNLPVMEAVSRIRTELAAGKWMDVPGVKSARYPFGGVGVFDNHQDEIMGDMMLSQAVTLLPGVRGG